MPPETVTERLAAVRLALRDSDPAVLAAVVELAYLAEQSLDRQHKLEDEMALLRNEFHGLAAKLLGVPKLAREQALALAARAQEIAGGK